MKELMHTYIDDIFNQIEESDLSMYTSEILALVFE
jgi:hypothetical protein